MAVWQMQISEVRMQNCEFPCAAARLRTNCIFCILRSLKSAFLQIAISSAPWAKENRLPRCGGGGAGEDVLN